MFDFKPRIFSITEEYKLYFNLLYTNRLTNIYEEVFKTNSSPAFPLYMRIENNTLLWYAETYDYASPGQQWNKVGTTYYYIALG